MFTPRRVYSFAARLVSPHTRCHCAATARAISTSSPVDLFCPAIPRSRSVLQWLWTCPLSWRAVGGIDEGTSGESKWPSQHQNNHAKRLSCQRWWSAGDSYFVGGVWYDSGYSSSHRAFYMVYVGIWTRMTYQVTHKVAHNTPPWDLGFRSEPVSGFRWHTGGFGKISCDKIWCWYSSIPSKSTARMRHRRRLNCRVPVRSLHKFYTQQ